MAIEAAHKLVNDNPNHTMTWGFNDTLAEAYKIDGNKKKALYYYKIAKSLAPENQLKYFEKAIKELQN